MNFAGSFVFNELRAISFRCFSRHRLSLSKGNAKSKLRAANGIENSPGRPNIAGKILQFRLIILVLLIYTRNCSSLTD